MLRKLIAFAITSGLAKKAWDHYRAERRPFAADPVDITEVVARPAGDPSRRSANRRKGARRRAEGPSS